MGKKISSKEGDLFMELPEEPHMVSREPQPVSYSPGLRLRAIRFIDENTLEYDFEGIDAADEMFQLARSNDNRLGIWVYNFEQDFARRYRGVPAVFVVGPALCRGVRGCRGRRR